MRHAIAIVALLMASTASADVMPYHGPWLVADAHIVARGTDAPRAEQLRAVAAARRSAQSFVARIAGCLRDHGGSADGRVSARLEYDRATLPSRTRVIEGQGALRACVTEVLPSIALDEPPHGRVVLEVTLAGGHGTW